MKKSIINSLPCIVTLATGTALSLIFDIYFLVLIGAFFLMFGNLFKKA